MSRYRKANHAASHPVARAIALARMRSHMTTVGVDIYLRTEGEASLDLLSHLAWLIGIGAEIAANVAPGQLEARRLHGALRSVIQMAAAGGAWKSALATTLHKAADDAKALLVKHPDLGLQFVPSGDFIAAKVKAGQVSLDDVAGAEIYQQQATEGTA